MTETLLVIALLIGSPPVWIEVRTAVSGKQECWWYLLEAKKTDLTGNGLVNLWCETISKKGSSGTRMSLI